LLLALELEAQLEALVGHLEGLQGGLAHHAGQACGGRAHVDARQLGKRRGTAHADTPGGDLAACPPLSTGLPRLIHSPVGARAGVPRPGIRSFLGPRAELGRCLHPSEVLHSGRTWVRGPPPTRAAAAQLGSERERVLCARGLPGNLRGNGRPARTGEPRENALAARPPHLPCGARPRDMAQRARRNSFPIARAGFLYCSTFSPGAVPGMRGPPRPRGAGHWTRSRSPLPAGMTNWTHLDAEALFNVAKWGSGYFGINSQGRLIVRPDGRAASEQGEVDL